MRVLCASFIGFLLFCPRKTKEQQRRHKKAHLLYCSGLSQDRLFLCRRVVAGSDANKTGAAKKGSLACVGIWPSSIRLAPSDAIPSTMQ